MRWLIIALLVSLVALLIAAAGMARHIWLQRRSVGSAAPPEAAVLPGKTDFESEP